MAAIKRVNIIVRLSYSKMCCLISFIVNFYTDQGRGWVNKRPGISRLIEFRRMSIRNGFKTNQKSTIIEFPV